MAIKNEVVEKGLQPIWNKIKCVGTDIKNATVGTQFADESTAEELSTQTLKYN